MNQLVKEQEDPNKHYTISGKPPQIYEKKVFEYREKIDKILVQGDFKDSKHFIRYWVQEIKLVPKDLEVEISYRIPESMVNELVAGGGFEPPTFGL